MNHEKTQKVISLPKKKKIKARVGKEIEESGSAIKNLIQKSKILLKLNLFSRYLFKFAYTLLLRGRKSTLKPK
jgi:hypothetical protein